jgi:hypothetical protein
MIVFKSAPKRGKENVCVKYNKTYEIKGLKLNFKHDIVVLSNDEKEMNDITSEVIEVLLREEKIFTGENIVFKLNKGYNIPEESAKGLYGKILECSIETEFQVKTQYPTMEEIYVKKK